MIGFQPLQPLSRLSNYTFWEIAIEFAIIWLVVYAIVRFVKGTRAAGALKGIIFLILAILALRLVTPENRFQRLGLLFDRFLAFAAIALVVIFQPELRRALIRLGETSFLRQTDTRIATVVDALVAAATFLSKNKFGAIIAIERQVGLRETFEAGRIINADLSAELVQSIFWPNNPLHDMGVVVRGDKLVAAGVQFPLADPQEMSDPRLGTRHRAAVGLTRNTDALVIVISEESGAISLAERGALERWLTPESLQEELSNRLASVAPADPADASVDLEGDVPPAKPASSSGKDKAPAEEQAA